MGPNQELAVECARKAHGDLWKMSGDESVGDRLAAEIKKRWQEAVLATAPGQFETDYAVRPGLRERIALVDEHEGTAYEIKPSPNNAHLHFYRHIFKVLLAKERKGVSIGRFVFLCPEKAQRQLQNSMGGMVIEYAKSLGLHVEIVRP
jgi:hypothetical protein